MTDILKRATNIMLYEKDKIGDILRTLRELHDFYESITGVGAGNMNTDKSILLPSGKAIGPGQAAHCLLEGQRTAIFLRGIHKAIRKLQTIYPGERINILYAGCGPYAALLTPLTVVFAPDEVSFHLMDINEISLNAARELYERLGLNDYVTAFLLTDAAAYRAEDGTDFHLIISETMQQALKKEPQVAIMQNLIPQLPAQGIFIPQEIRVSAQLLCPRLEEQSFMTAGMNPERVNLGNIYTISSKELTGHQPVTLNLPEQLEELHALQLMTDITVYGDEVLTAYNCSLNLPVNILRDVRPYAGKTICFHYETNEVPGFRYSLELHERAAL